MRIYATRYQCEAVIRALDLTYGGRLIRVNKLKKIILDCMEKQKRVDTKHFEDESTEVRRFYTEDEITEVDILGSTWTFEFTGILFDHVLDSVHKHVTVAGADRQDLSSFKRQRAALRAAVLEAFLAECDAYEDVEHLMVSNGEKVYEAWRWLGCL